MMEPGVFCSCIRNLAHALACFSVGIAAQMGGGGN